MGVVEAALAVGEARDGGVEKAEEKGAAAAAAAAEVEAAAAAAAAAAAEAKETVNMSQWMERA